MIETVEKNHPNQVARNLVTDVRGHRFIVSTIKDDFLTKDFFTAVFDAHPEGDYPATFEDRISQLRKPSLEEGLNTHPKTCEDLEICLIPLH